MVGLVRYSSERGREETIGGVRFLTVQLPPPKRGLLRRRTVQKAAREFQRLRIVRAVFPEPFPDREIFARAGIFPVETLPLYRALAGELVRQALAGREGGSVVAVRAQQLTAEVRRTVTELCIRNRYVLLNAPDRNGSFSRQLRREYGAPVVQTSDPAQLGRAAAVVCFSPYAGAPEGQTVIDLSREDAVPNLRLELEGQELPEGCCRAQLLAALWAAGAIRPSQITSSFS